MSSSSSNSSSSSGSSSDSISSFLTFALAALPRPLADVGAGAGGVLGFDPLSFLGNISSSSSSSETFAFFFLLGVFFAGRPRLPGVLA